MQLVTVNDHKIVRLQQGIHKGFATMTKHQRKHSFQPSQEAGYTILEAIVAMVVVSVLMIAIAPVIAFSTATRVQARRLELATQAARTYIDGVRAGGIAAPELKVTMNPPASPSTPLDLSAFSTTSAPATSDLAGDCTFRNSYCTNNSLYCVNLDETPGCQANSVRDMVVQGYRSVNPTSDAPTLGYLLGVRVYRADSFKQDVIIANPPTRQQSSLSSGLGNPSLPVTIMTTEIPPLQSLDSSSREGLCARLGCNDNNP